MEKPKSPNMGKVILQRHSAEFPSPDPDFAELSAQAEVLIYIINKTSCVDVPTSKKQNNKKIYHGLRLEGGTEATAKNSEANSTHLWTQAMQAPASPWLGP
uniref:Uncharacterized protein n=2 Tax=Anthoceros TaxID=3233 RepID=A0A6M8AYH3_ANTPU|nr:hypothetical protein [Anthoceros punctatus]YP_009863201.1 hypothetical protein [Anthoceros agrestis]QKD76615.1 hypothetical protein [Anthoceros punctatus]QKD76657.1 hypothetical protein [Anthoceros agrestis]